MNRLLALAQFLLGEELRAHVFEPLVADWQRELAATPTALARAAGIARGFAAFSYSLVYCVLTGGVVVPRAAVVKGLAVLVASTFALLGIQIGVNATAIANDFPVEMRVWMALPMVLPMAVPLAALPIMMLLRGLGGITSGGAAGMIGTAALLAYLAAGWISPALQGDFRGELYEEMYQRAVINDRAGRVTSYPATAVRQMRRTTPEQRAAARLQLQRNPRMVAAIAERTRPRWGLSTMMVAALAIAMGALGWALGGLGRNRAVHALGWWGFAWFALLILDGRFLYPGNFVSQTIGRPPAWVPVAVFAAAALTLTIAARRRENNPNRGMVQEG